MRFELGSVTEQQIVTYFQTSSRIERASQILDHVTKDAPGICIVQSQTSPKKRYVTDTRAGTCECPDFTFRFMKTENFKCKHLLACELRERVGSKTQ